MKNVELVGDNIGTFQRVSPNKTYVIKYESFGERFGLICATSYEGNEYETLSTEEFTKGNRYGIKGSLESVIFYAINRGDRVIEFDSVSEALKYVVEGLKQQV